MDITEKALLYAKEIFKDDFSGHDFSHTLRVFKTAKKIALEENADTLEVLLTAALHDVDDHKLFTTSKTKEHAREFLNKNSVPRDVIEKIINDIDNISYSKGNSKLLSLEGRIVCDADRLDAIGAVGIARCFAYGGSRNRSLDTSLEHFTEKLFNIKDLMLTNTGKSLALKRHEFLKEFYKNYLKETTE